MKATRRHEAIKMLRTLSEIELTDRPILELAPDASVAAFRVSIGARKGIKNMPTLMRKNLMTKNSRRELQRLSAAGYGAFASAIRWYARWQAFCLVGKCNWVKIATGSRSIEASMWSHLRRFHKLPNPGFKIRSGGVPKPWVVMFLPKLRPGVPVRKKFAEITTEELRRVYDKYHPSARTRR